MDAGGSGKGDRAPSSITSKAGGSSQREQRGFRRKFELLQCWPRAQAQYSGTIICQRTARRSLLQIAGAMTRFLVSDMGGALADFEGEGLLARRKPAVAASLAKARRCTRCGPSSCTVSKQAPAVRRISLRPSCRASSWTLSPAQFLAEFRAAARGFYEGALELAERARSQASLAQLEQHQRCPVAAPERLGSEDPFHAHHPSHVSGFRQVRSARVPSCRRASRCGLRVLIASTTAPKTWPPARRALAGEPGAFAARPRRAKLRVELGLLDGA